MAEGDLTRTRLEERLDGAKGIERAEILFFLAGEDLRSDPARSIESSVEALGIVSRAPPADRPASGWGELRGRILLRIAQACNSTRDFKAAEKWARQAADALLEAGLLDEKAGATCIQAEAAAELGDVQAAEAILDAGLTAHGQEGGGDAGRVALLKSIGELRLRRGRSREAVEPLTRAASLAGSLEDGRLEVNCLQALGTAQLILDDHQAALLSFDHALAVARRSKNQAAEAQSLGSRAQVLSKLGRFSDALDSAQRSIAYHRRAGQPGEIAHSLDLLAIILLDAGAPEEAESYSRESLGYWREVGAKGRQASTLTSVATACQQTGKCADATRHATRAVVLAREVDDPIHEAYGNLILAACHSDQGDIEAAWECTRAASARAEVVDYSHLKSLCAIQAAELELLANRHEAAIQTLEPVWPVESLITAPRDLAALHDVAYRAYFGAGDQVAALEHLSRCREVEQAASRNAAAARIQHLRVKLRLDEALAAANDAGRRAARRSAAQLAAIIENTPNVAVVGTDFSGTIRLWNQATETLTGWAAEEALGLNLKHLVIPPGDHGEYEELLQFLDVKSERVGPRERRALRKDGSEWTGLTTSFPMVTDTGDRLVIHMVLDVTERVRLAEALKLSEERFSKAFFASPNSVTLSTLDDGRFIEVNEGFERIFGVPRQDALGKGSLELGLWRHAADRERMIKQLTGGGRARLDDVEYRHASGREGVADVAMERIEVSGEECLLTVVRDITAQKKAEADLRAALAEVGRLKARLEAENVYLQEEIRRDQGVDRILGTSEVMMQLMTTVRLVARTDATVLILGETGTGKELVARTIHDLSARREHTLVKVNCAAVSAGLVESELFGHEKGAFTGAERQRQGRFELADDGSIFLDEIGELPPEVQVKLLRVLQEQEFERVGSSTPLEVNVRVIAVTNRDLEAEVEAGRFRADLYYRLNVFPIVVPPLRERTVDIPEMAEYFLDRVSRRIGKRFHGIRPATMEWMTSYQWPGNVRELGNFIERAAILAEGPWIDHRQAVPRPMSPTVPSAPAKTESLEEVQRAHVVSVLERCHWKIEGESGAAAALHLNPSTLRSRMKKLGIRRN